MNTPMKQDKTIEKDAQGRIIIDASQIDALVFDLDGVVTRTARVHAAAWKELFDDFLRCYSDEHNLEFREFTEEDMLQYVDGKPRYNGVKSFLESRGISLPWGDVNDAPEQQTICGLGNRKNVNFQRQLHEQGVEVFESTVKMIRQWRAHGRKAAVVTSSKNCSVVLELTGLTDLFDEKIDGVDAEEQKLKGKPDPETFLIATEKIGARAKRTAMFEDAISGVQAGAAGEFAMVVGINRGEDEMTPVLLENGADVVVRDLEEMVVKF